VTSPAIVYLVCHQTKYLDVVLAGLARQTRRPDLIVVSCDVDRPDIGQLIERWAPRVGTPLAWVRRAHHGIARCSQVRNNAARYIIRDLGITDGRLIQLDADMLATPTLVEQHETLGRETHLVYPYRADVPREQSEALTGDAILASQAMPQLTTEILAKLAKRDRRYRRQLFFRRFGLGPRHKPKLLGSNWSAPISIWRELNGFDEHYQGWGFLDDEFARRAARAGFRCTPACAAIIGFHLWHPTRQPTGPMSDNPNHQRFIRTDLPTRAEHGLDNEVPQHPVSATLFQP
jgi:hypothetical protein